MNDLQRRNWLKDNGTFVKKFGPTPAAFDLLGEHLDVIRDRGSYVKVVTDRIPREPLIEKMRLYRDRGLRTYLDHAYFGRARMYGDLEQRVGDAHELGVAAIEFYNIGEPIAPDRWRDLYRRATDTGLEVIYEYHPPMKFGRPGDPSHAVRVDADEILRVAGTVLDCGARYLMLDHDTHKHAVGGLDTYEQVMDRLGRDRVVVEVESQAILRDMRLFIGRFGRDVPLSNITFEQALAIEALRDRAAAQA